MSRSPTGLRITTGEPTAAGATAGPDGSSDPLLVPRRRSPPEACDCPSYVVTTTSSRERRAYFAIGYIRRLTTTTGNLLLMLQILGCVHRMDGQHGDRLRRRPDALAEAFPARDQRNPPSAAQSCQIAKATSPVAAAVSRMRPLSPATRPSPRRPGRRPHHGRRSARERSARRAGRGRRRRRSGRPRSSTSTGRPGASPPRAGSCTVRRGPCPWIPAPSSREPPAALDTARPSRAGRGDAASATARAGRPDDTAAAIVIEAQNRVQSDDDEVGREAA